MRVTIEGISQKADDKVKEMENNRENTRKLNDSWRFHPVIISSRKEMGVQAGG